TLSQSEMDESVSQIETNTSSTARSTRSSEASSSKQTQCNRLIASRALVSSTMKVRFTLEEPNEIIETLMSLMAEKSRAAMPGVLRKPSPTIETIVRPSSTSTVPSCCRSGINSGNALASSIESETLTSEVVTTSTAVRCRSKTSNNARRKPYAPSIRAELTCTVVIPFLWAIALTVCGAASDSATINVPASSGACELQTRTGMFRSMAG